MGKVNGETFLPGDKILFKRGETWTGTTLAVTWSGTSNKPITFGAYGNGDRPVIDGNDTVNCLLMQGRSYITLSSLDVTRGLDSGFTILDISHHITVTDCHSHACGNDNLLIFNQCYSVTVIGGEYYNAYERVVGPQVSGIEIADGCYDIVVDGATCRNQTDGAGMTIHSHIGTTMPYNVEIKNCTFHTNAQYGIIIFKQDDTADTNRNITVSNCISRDNILDGIRISKTVAATNYPNGITIDQCVIKDNTRYAMWAEGDSISFTRTLFHEGRMCYVRDCQTFVMINCTLYLTTWVGYSPLTINNNGARQNGVQVQNCIVASPDAGTYIANVEDATGVDYDYNLYDRPVDALSRWRWVLVLKNWASWLADSGQDANSPAAPQDALFTDIAADDFTLQAGSPARGVGADLGHGTDLGAYQFGS
jgi:hypothetical protein